MSVIGKIVRYQKVYGFVLHAIGGDGKGEVEKVLLSRACWEGPHLVLVRGMRADGLSLFEDLSKVHSLQIVMVDRDQVPTHRWTIEHEGMRDRGFLFMDASQDETAMEAVCLLHAQLKRAL